MAEGREKARVTRRAMATSERRTPTPVAREGCQGGTVAPREVRSSLRAARVLRGAGLASTSGDRAGLHVVVDTNVLVESLETFEGFVTRCRLARAKNTNGNGGGGSLRQLSVCIPWTVLSELDKLKGGPWRNFSVSFKATRRFRS